MGEELVWYNSRTWGVFGVVEKRQVVRSHTFETRDRIRKIECIKVKAEEKEREQSMAQPVKLKQLHYVMKGLPEPKILVCIQYMYS